MNDIDKTKMSSTYFFSIFVILYDTTYNNIQYRVLLHLLSVVQSQKQHNHKNYLVDSLQDIFIS